MAEQTFEEDLMDLLDQHADLSLDEKISVLELRIMALKEEAGMEDED